MPCPVCTHRFGFTNGSYGTCSNCAAVTPLSQWGEPPRKRVYRAGSHGYKKKEQKALGTSGSSHESEHAIGYEVLGKGKKRGRPGTAREIENHAPAYQEHKPDHRAHIGTGNHGNYNNTGDSSSAYRKRQRTAVEQGSPGNAVQLNQLEYAYQSGFQDNVPGRLKADRSFQTMVDNMDSFPYWDESSQQMLVVRADSIQRAEAGLARRMARSKRLPTRAEELAEMKRLGIIPSVDEIIPTSDRKLASPNDRHGIPQDGDCLFHAIGNRLVLGLGGNIPDASANTLRAQAVGFLRYDSGFLSAEPNPQAYLTQMALPGTWGGGPEIAALAQIYGVSIVVIASDYSVVFNEQSIERTITIYYDGVGHYSIAP